MSRPVLPKDVMMPTVVEMNHATLIKALRGPSRQKLHQWRRNADFPAATPRGRTTFTRTADLAAWLVARNVNVIWI